MPKIGVALCRGERAIALSLIEHLPAGRYEPEAPADEDEAQDVEWPEMRVGSPTEHHLEQMARIVSIRPFCASSRASSIVIPSSATTWTYCRMTSTIARNSSKYPTREISISASRSRWTSPANFCPTTSTTFDNFSAEGAPTPDSRICWIEGARSINGTISRQKPRKEH